MTDEPTEEVPCPFCGNKDIGYNRYQGKALRHVCTECLSSGPIVYGNQERNEVWVKAKLLWDTRVQKPVDLTKITSAFGLLSKETQLGLKSVNPNHLQRYFSQGWVNGCYKHLEPTGIYHLKSTQGNQMKMKYYVGTTGLMAKPMTLGEYNLYRGWGMPSNENPTDEGYLLIREIGTKTWCPKSSFEQCNAVSGNLTFGHALFLMKAGARMCRTGWNGKGMFIFLVPGSKFIVNREPLLSIFEDGTEVTYSSHIDMKTADGTVVPWLASQTDMLAEDYCILSDI